MRAVFTGITGVSKERVAQLVALEAARERGLPQSLQDSFTSQYIQVLSLEEEIKAEVGDLRPFLDQVVVADRQRLWQEAMRRVLDKARSSENTILCLHNIFSRRSNYLQCVDWDLLCAFRPTIFVTLINDVYDVWETINARERELSTNSYFHLSEILAWRSAEISATQHFADNLYVKPESYGMSAVEVRDLETRQCKIVGAFGKSVPHFVVAAKHPSKTLFRLLFRRDCLVLYASFPITAPRRESDTSGRHEIDSFRQRLYEAEFITMMDPLTIDEFRFANPWKPGDTPLLPRWRLTFGPPMLNEVQLTTDPFRGYGVLEFEAFRSAVGHHVETRDYQLVSQSAAIAAYRPFYGGPMGSGKAPPAAPSGGVDKELVYASREMKQVFAVHPECDRASGPKVFSSIDFAIQPADIDGLLEQLARHQQKRTAKMKERGEDLTWETKHFSEEDREARV